MNDIIIIIIRRRISVHCREQKENKKVISYNIIILMCFIILSIELFDIKFIK